MQFKFLIVFAVVEGEGRELYNLDNLVWFCKAISKSLVCFCRYVIGTLELLVAENYMIVYLNGATTRRKMPSLGWLRKCYQQIDRRYCKYQLKASLNNFDNGLFRLNFIFCCHLQVPCVHFLNYINFIASFCFLERVF